MDYDFESIWQRLEAAQWDLELVKEALADPRVYRYSNKFNQTLLHVLCQSSVPASSEVFKLVIEAYPDNIFQKTNGNNKTCLHLAASKGNVDAVRLMLLFHPESSGSLDSLLNTPLHCACIAKEGMDETIIGLLVEANAASLLLKNREGFTPLHLAVEAVGKSANNNDQVQSSNIISILCTVCPQAAGISDRGKGVAGGLSPRSAATGGNPLDIVSRLLTNNELRYDLPLHLALYPHATKINWQVVERLLVAFPTAAGCMDKDNRIPLCVATSKNSPVSTVRALLAAHSAAVFIREGEAHASALLHAINCCDSEEAALAILEHFPAGAFDRNAVDRLLLFDVAASCRKWDVTFQILGLFCLSDLEAMNDLATNDPLSTLVSLNAPLVLVQGLIETFPTSPFLPLPNEQLALHIAASSFASLEVIETLLESNKKAAKKIDFFGKLPLHYAAEKAQPGVIKALLKAYPEATSVFDCGNGGGKTPFMIALIFKGSWQNEAIEEMLAANPSLVCTLMHVENDDGSSPPLLPFFLAERLEVPFEVLATILAYSMPVCKGSGTPNPHNRFFLWHTLLMDSSGRYEALVEAMLEEFDFLVHSLSQALDKHGRLTALQVASHSCKRLLLDRMYLFGRYQGIFEKSASSPSSPLPALPPSSPSRDQKKLGVPLSSSPSYSSLTSKPTLGHYYPSPSKKKTRQSTSSPFSPPQATSHPFSYSLRPLFIKMQDAHGICGLLGFDKLGTVYPFDNKLVGLVLFREYGDFILEASMHNNNSEDNKSDDVEEGRDMVAVAARHVLLRTHVLEDGRPHQYELLERCLSNVLVSCNSYKHCLVFDVTGEQQLHEIIALARDRKRRLLLGGGGSTEEDAPQLPLEEEQDTQQQIEEKDKVEEPQTHHIPKPPIPPRSKNSSSGKTPARKGRAWL